MLSSWREAPMPPLEGEVPNECEAEGFARKLSVKPLSQPVRAASSPFRGAEGASRRGLISFKNILQKISKGADVIVILEGLPKSV